MSAAYERVRKALEGTPLAGDLERLNAELHLTPESAEWAIAVLASIGTAALARDLQAVERALGRLPDTLESSMRASSVEIVRGLADDISQTATTAIRSDTIAMLQRAANAMEDVVAGLAAEATKATKATTDSARANITAASSSMSTASVNLAKSASKVGGWTPSRYAAVGLGMVLAAGMFALGTIVREADTLLQCPARIEHVADRWHLTPHDRNALRNYVCKS